MLFLPTNISGAFEVRSEPIADNRGDFARSFCVDEFKDNNIQFRVVQANISRNQSRGTLRGMHYQAEPVPDPKFVRCIRGRVFDVVIDLRLDSPSFRRWTSIELDAEKQNAIFVSPGCAHGFLTREDNCDVEYLMGAPYVQKLSRGVRWDDPAFAISWPSRPNLISDRDALYPDFDFGA